MIHVGASGYVYKDWRDHFYRGVPNRLWLARYAGVFGSVELNNAFYGLPKPGLAGRWRDAVPPDFVFAAKGSRYITHMKKLSDPGPALERY